MQAMVANCCFIQCMGVQHVVQPRARSAPLRPTCAPCAAIPDMGAGLRHILGWASRAAAHPKRDRRVATLKGD